MDKIIILNGPNLNLLGEREKNQYGNFTLKDIEKICNEYANKNDIKLSMFQSNIEGELVEKIQSSRNNQEILPINYIPSNRPRSQDSKSYVIENGAFYIFGKYNFDITHCRLHGAVDFYLMDELRSIDIDEEEDIKFANYISNYL